MPNKLKNIFLVCFSLISTFSSVISQNLGPTIEKDLTPSQYFEKGNESYENGDYSIAIGYYLAIDSSNMYSAEAYQNLGNTYYKTNNVPEAIYYFEKALKYNPGNEDILHNLELANKRTIDKNNAANSSGLLSWISSSIGKSPDYWAVFSLVSICIGALLLGLIILFKWIKLNRFMRVFGLIFIGIGFILFTFASIQSSQINTYKYGISFSPSAEIKNEPSESASTAFVLHEGSKLEILDTNKDWYKIKFNNQVGWISKGGVKLI